MRIVVATPLYPPEIAEPAPYVKELAKRICEHHSVTIVAYVRLPEKVSNVCMVAIDKRQPLPLRLFTYFVALLRTVRNADIIYAMNGASVEMPVFLVSLVVQRPLIIRIGDVAAHKRAQKHWLSRLIERFAFSRARNVLTETLPTRPEILPFQPFPTEKQAIYEHAWKAHLHSLEEVFSHAIT